MSGMGAGSFGQSFATSLSLLKLVKKRDQTACRKLVALYSPFVYGLCLKAELQHADAADVGQEVFSSVMGKIRSFRRDRPGHSFRGWLYQISLNKIRDHYRDKRQHPVIDGVLYEEILEEYTTEKDRLPMASDEEKWIYQGVVEMIREEFEDKTWIAFWKVTVEDQRSADVAASLGMSLNAVYLARSRVLRRLREELYALDLPTP